MAYQAKRRKLYEEDFELVDEQGNVVHTLKVALDADSVVKKLSEKHVALTRALADLQEVKTDNALEVLGNAVVDILEAVFGTEGAETILEFYENKYIEMCREVMPFVTNVVIPEVRKISQSNKKTVLSQYNRKQRRALKRSR